jgi:hypothetical protein
VNFCPDGGCESSIVVFKFEDGISTEAKNRLMAVEEAVFGGRYYALTNYEVVSPSTTLFATQDDQAIVYCQWGENVDYYPMEYRFVWVWAASTNTLEHLTNSIGMRDSIGMEKSFEECQ